jgi:hypothetical protein
MTIPRVNVSSYQRLWFPRYGRRRATATAVTAASAAHVERRGASPVAVGLR